jgi:hypothetical protein
MIHVYRRPESLHFKRWPDKSDDWGNNDANNSLDRFVYEDDLETAGGSHLLFECKAQTVSNIPGGRFENTLAPGPFQLRLFVDPRAFRGRIHGICNASDIEGDTINDKSIQSVQGKHGEPISYDRWLMHDWQKHAPAPEGEDTRVAWSAGCIVIPDLDLMRFGIIMDELYRLAGELIDGEIVMVA